MTLGEIRTKYLAFFKAREHAIIPSAPLVPENDPTTLFTGSGMQPLVPYLLGKDHPMGVRLVNSQKSFRAEDIEEVGDNRHTTFFEMLGNWSLGDYFKSNQLRWFFTFLTDEKEGVNIDPSRLYVTVFAGDEKAGIGPDREAADIWKALFAEKGIDAADIEIISESRGSEVGMQGGRIFYYEAKKNWWSRAGVPEKMPPGEPGGGDSEVFFDFYPQAGEKCIAPGFGPFCHPNCDCGRFMEIGNSVFMEFIKNADGTFGKLPKHNVDFGGGLERIAAASEDTPDVFKIDVFRALIERMEELSGASYNDPEKIKSFRVVADHLRGATFLIADGIVPGNVEQGYFVRRLLRRAVQHSDRLGIPAGVMDKLVPVIADLYKEHYAYFTPEKVALIQTEIAGEEAKFRKTLERGMKIFEKAISDVPVESVKEIDGVSIENVKTYHGRNLRTIDGETAFTLFTSYGFPIELVKEIASERGLEVDEAGFKAAMQKHQELSRAGSEQKFKGGLADTSDMSVKYHTGTHLLHKALRDVLGPDATQKGSNITPERLRFDFAFSRKMTPEEIKQIEDAVNARIDEALPVTFEDLSLDEAQKRGALGLFEEKYGDKVRVYKIGDYSLEFCGGPHVENTAKLGEDGKRFKIQKEEAVGAGVRRIRAVLA
jgi:alanyl-tRNA synthetase